MSRLLWIGLALVGLLCAQTNPTRRVDTGTSAPTAGTCDGSVEVGYFYVQTGDPASVDPQVWACMQDGASSYSWYPISHLSGTTAPAKCEVGSIFFDTDADAGSNLFGCTAADTWTLLGGAGGLHASSHSEDGADEVTVENLASNCTDTQVLGGTSPTGGTECQADVAGGITSGPVSGIPGSPATGDAYVVTDGTTPWDCSTGGESTNPWQNVCMYTADSQWQALRDNNIDIRWLGAIDGSGTSDDEIQVALGVCEALGSQGHGGHSVTLPPGRWYTDDPILLPKSGNNPTARCKFMGSGKYESHLQATGTWAAGEGVIEWEAVTTRDVGSWISDMRITPPTNAQTHAIYFAPTCEVAEGGDGCTNTESFNEYLSHLTLKNLLIMATNQYTEVAIELIGHVRFVEAINVTIDPSATSRVYDTIAIRTSTDANAAAGDYRGMNYSYIRNLNCNERRGGYCQSFYGRFARSYMIDGFCNGTYDNGKGCYEFYKSVASTFVGIGTEGYGDSAVSLDDCHHFNFTGFQPGTPNSQGGGTSDVVVLTSGSSNNIFNSRWFDATKPEITPEKVVNLCSGCNWNQFLNWDLTSSSPHNPASYITDAGTGNYFEFTMTDDSDRQLSLGAHPSLRPGNDIASAATISVDAGGDFYHVTGTTGITTINTCDADVSGAIKTFIFDGILTVTDGSNLELDGDFVTAAESTLVLRCDGTSWSELGRTPLGTRTVAQGGTGLTAGTSGGVPYFASTSTMASSALLTDEVLIKGGGAGAAPEDSTLTETEVKTRQAAWMVGADNGSVMVDADDQDSFYLSDLGSGITLTKVWCETDAGTSTINLQRDDGSPANILSASLSCDADGQDSCASGCDVNTIQDAEDNIADGEKIDFEMVAAGGTAKRVVVYLKYTID